MKKCIWNKSSKVLDLKKLIFLNKNYILVIKNHQRDKLDMQLKETENLKQALSKSKEPAISSYKFDSLQNKPNIR